MPSSHQQVYLINGTLVDFFNNPINLTMIDGPTGPQGATGTNGLRGSTGPTGSTAATSKFIKEWITAGNERLTILTSEISQYSPGILIGKISSSKSDVQIQLWRINSAFVDPDPESHSKGAPTFWQLISPADYTITANGESGDIYIDLTYRLVNSTRTRAVVVC